MLTLSEHMIVLSAGTISHNSMQLLIITTEFVPFPNLLDMSFSFVLYFLRVLSLETYFCSILKFCRVF